MHPLTAQAHAAAIARRRRRFIAAAVSALRQIRHEDHLLGLVQPSLTPAAWEEIAAEIDTQDERLADATTDLLTLSDFPQSTQKPETRNQKP